VRDWDIGPGRGVLPGTKFPFPGHRTMAQVIAAEKRKDKRNGGLVLVEKPEDQEPA
jgi:hypothetical protein